MQEKTNLDAVKHVAKSLLMLEPDFDVDYPFIVHHSFMSTPFFSTSEGMLDIRIPEQFDKVVEHMAGIIDRANSVASVEVFITKPYKSVFFKLIQDYLDPKDYGRTLQEVWTTSENPNQDVNVSIALWIKYFKKADKHCIMDDIDYAVYDELPDQVTIYRGVAEGREPYGLSWTNNYDTASWFAHRFQTKNPYILTTTCDKKDVFAYFNRRNEDELVVNIKALDKSQITKLEGDNL